ncbi:MAG: hypothetical protein JXR56_00230 [Candidatus Cloacimonetes bacterium]|nr:hypothetical protein [Candidatus Cloacimonadota bacterium]
MRRTMITIITFVLLISVAIPVTALTGNDYILAKNEAIENAKLGDEFIQTNPPDYQQAVNAYEKALEKYKELLTEAPAEDSLQVQIDILIKNLSIANKSAGNYEEALEYFDMRLAQNPNDESLYIQKFDILKNDLDREAKGVEMLEKYLESNTSTTLATQVANYYYFRAKDYAQAVKWYEYIQANTPEPDANFYKNIISSYKKVKNYPKSIELSKEYLKINPPEEDVISTYKSIGVAYQQLKDDKNALDWYVKYLEKEADPKVALWVCNAYYKQKDDNKVIKYANMVIEKDTGKKVVYFLRGVAKFNLGDKEAAKADFEIAKDDAKYGVHAQKYLDSMK